jgi:hypothetical protein
MPWATSRSSGVGERKLSIMRPFQVPRAWLLPRALGLLVLMALPACTSGSSGRGFLASTIASPGSKTTPGSTTAPVVSLATTITAPANDTQIAAVTTVTFQGQAFDTHGAPLPGSALAWASTIDGPLGTGSVLTVSSLSPGIHRITLTATAPGGLGTDSILMIVGGTGGASGQELLAYMASLPGRLLGDPITIPPSVPNMINANPCDINGISGNGALSACFSAAGTVTCLRYPSPSYYNQVDYLSMRGHALGFGSIDNQGMFAGLSVDLGGGTKVTTWFRDATWTRTQSYRSDDSAVLVTVYESASLGLQVTNESFVHPAEDTLVQHYSVALLPGSTVNPKVGFLYYENLSPCTTKIPYLPVFDVYCELLNDFACGYHTGDDAIIHFRPDNADYGKLLAFGGAPHPNLTADVDAWLDAAGTTFGPGVYFAIGSDAPSSGHQCGADLGLVAPPNPATDPTLDAYTECSLGALTGNPIALVRANAALSRDIDLTSGSASVTFYVAAGLTPDGAGGARQRLARARATTYATYLNDVEQDSSQWLSRARLPHAPADAQTIAFAKRSLIVARTAIDRTSGAIVASLASQLPYSEDWVRDGAFINYALDTAGYPEIVEKHNLFYASVQRSSGLLAGTYDMNFYADGVPGGPVPLEIDEAAFGVWTMAVHADFITDPVHRASYLGQVYPAIKRGADFVAGWRDPLNGLQLPANEDDNIMPTASLHGAGPILLAIRSAIAAGQATGESPAVLQGWAARATELQAAIDRTYWDPAVNAFHNTSAAGNPLGPPVQPSAWLVWPVEMLPLTDARVLSTCDWLYSNLLPVVTHQVTESAYDAKTTLSLAFAWQNDPVKQASLRSSFSMFTHDLPTPGTNHVGEFYKYVTAGGTSGWQSQNDVPHVWEHMLIYHTAVELYP